jgi:hypothetical protein
LYSFPIILDGDGPRPAIPSESLFAIFTQSEPLPTHIVLAQVQEQTLPPPPEQPQEPPPSGEELVALQEMLTVKVVHYLTGSQAPEKRQGSAGRPADVSPSRSRGAVRKSIYRTVQVAQGRNGIVTTGTVRFTLFNRVW